MLGKVAVNHLKIRSMAAPWRRFPYLRMRMKISNGPELQPLNFAALGYSNPAGMTRLFVL
jgi:hypothetical protein